MTLALLLLTPLSHPQSSQESILTSLNRRPWQGARPVGAVGLALRCSSVTEAGPFGAFVTVCAAPTP